MKINSSASPKDGIAFFPEQLSVPRVIKAEVRETEPYDVDLEITLEEGRYQVRKLTLLRKPGGPPVSGEGARRIPIASIVRAVIEATLFPQGLANLLPPQPERGAPTAETLQAVAFVYRLARVMDFPPVRKVAEHFGRPRPTASRWIQAAREAGYIPKPGRL